MRVDNDVLAVLSSAELSANAVRLSGQLDRKLYERTNKVLEAAGGKWSRKDKAHMFDCDSSDRIEQIILTASIDIPKDEFEYFPTPAAVVSILIDAADISDGMMVLEPSAGQGAIAKAVSGTAIGVIVDMYELMPANNDVLKSLSLPLSGVGDPVDFLTVHPNPVYDRVVMNPPFSKQADIKHVLHAFKFLKPGGLLVSVMANSVMFRENRLTVDFRDFVYSRGGSIEPLPEGSFKSSGTMVNTVVVTIPS